MANFGRYLRFAVILFAGSSMANEPIVQPSLDAVAILPTYAPLAVLREDATLRGVGVSPDGVVIAVGDHGVILRSDDGGESWRSVESPIHSQLCDVMWLPGERWIAVGGAYEPVTGLSRGVAVISDDAGQTWRAAKTDNTTKLRQLEFDPNSRTIQATGDPSEASGARLFQTFNGGENWVENSLPTDLVASPIPSTKPSLPGFHASFHDLVTTRTRSQIAVGDHGVIARLNTSGENDGKWHAVRGAGRRIAILFVAAQAGTTPWALLGRESLEEGQRCGLLIDSGDPTLPSSNRTIPQDRTEQAATMLGASFARSMDELGNDSSAADRLAQLRSLHPFVVVLDSNLPSNVMADWQHAVQQQISESGDGVTSAFVSESSFGDSKPNLSSTTLRGDALLPTMASLAADLHVDALMIAEPGRNVPSASTTRTLPVGTRVMTDRRSGTLGSGIVLPMDCQRTVSMEDSGSRRRLQITTARLSMQRRLETTLADPSLTTARLSSILDSMLLATAVEDRSRLLWTLMIQAFSDREPSLNDDCLEVLLQRTEAHAPEPGLRRWAELKRISRNGSGERRLVSTGTTWSNKESPVQTNDSFGSAPMLSPFQIQPVGYESHTAPFTPVLVPATRSSNPLPIYREATTRSNWEYHPTVLAARSVSVDDESTKTVTSLPIHPERPTLDAQLSDPCWPNATWWLDGECHLGLVSDGEYAYACVLVPTHCDLLMQPQSHRLRVGLDIDNDPLTHFQVELQPNSSSLIHKIDGRRQLTSHPNLLAATSNGQIIGSDVTNQWQVVAEMAIDIATLERFAIHSEIVGPTALPDFSPMPLPAQFRSFVHPRSAPISPSTK